MEKHSLILRSLLLFQLGHMVVSRRVVASVRSYISFDWSTYEYSRRPASKFMIDTGAGVIDADYRGVVFVLLFNLSDKDFHGM